MTTLSDKTVYVLRKLLLVHFKLPCLTLAEDLNVAHGLRSKWTEASRYTLRWWGSWLHLKGGAMSHFRLKHFIFILIIKYVAKLGLKTN